MTKKYSPKPRKPKPRSSPIRKTPAKPPAASQRVSRVSKKPKLNVAEELLWQQIKDAGLDDGGWHREFVFAAPRLWRADFCHLPTKLLVESEGVSYGGGHNSMNIYLKDIEKYNAATMLGYHVLRFTPDQITKSNIPINMLGAWLISRRK